MAVHCGPDLRTLVSYPIYIFSLEKKSIFPTYNPHVKEILFILEKKNAKFYYLEEYSSIN